MSYTRAPYKALVLLFFSALFSLKGRAQSVPVEIVFQYDSAKIEAAAAEFISKKCKKWERYLQRSGNTTDRYLKKIARREKRMLSILGRRDSVLLHKYNNLNIVSIDSMQSDNNIYSKLSGQAKQSHSKLRQGIDSLAKMKDFIAAYTKDGPIPNLDQQLAQLRLQVLKQETLKQNLLERTKVLGQLFSNTKYSRQYQKINGLASQYKEQLAYWQAVTNKPDEMEQKALDYLQGIEGFEQAVRGRTNTGGLSGKSEAELRALGYQTRQGTEENLQDAFGTQLQSMQERAAGSVQQCTEAIVNKVKGNSKIKVIESAVAKADKAKGLAAETKKEYNRIRSQQLQGLKNPMKGIPFRFRWEYDFNYQVHRASKEDGKPAIFQVGMNFGYQHNPNLVVGMGIDGRLGLGSSWKSLQLSYEGMLARVFLNHKFVWALRLEGGYEKSIRPMNREYTNTMAQFGGNNNVKTAMGLLQDAAYLGIQKPYKINSRLKGSVLIGYNFLNDKTKINSPWIFRMGWKL